MLQCVAGASFALLLACGAPDESGTPPPPMGLRVVSLSPTASAIALALGAHETLVAVDSESSRLPAFGGLRVVDLEQVSELHPDVLLAPAPSPEDAAHLAALRADGIAVGEIAPRSFDEVFELYRDLGAKLARPLRAAELADELGRALGALAAESHGRARPRVAALQSVEPFVHAPAHGFATDLIELAGGSSTAHDHASTPLPGSVAELAAAAPDLVLVVSDAPLSAPARAAARAALGEGFRVAFFPFDADRFWVRDAPDTVRRLRALLAPLSR